MWFTTPEAMVADGWMVANTAIIVPIALKARLLLTNLTEFIACIVMFITIEPYHVSQLKSSSCNLGPDSDHQQI